MVCLILWISLITFVGVSEGLEAESCNESDGCAYNNNSTILECRGYVDDVYREAKQLHLCKYDNTSLYLKDIVKRLPTVENVTITHSNFSYLYGANKGNFIKILKINNSTLKVISTKLVANLTNLRLLDLRNNTLDKLKVPFREYKHLTEIYLANNKWDCSKNMDWALNLSKITVKDYRLMKCSGERFAEKPVIPIAIFLQNTQVNCPSYCKCSMLNVVWDLTGRLRPIVEVNCSSRELVELPALLPNHTKIVRLERNSISDLDPLLTNKVYEHVLDLYLDHNEVESIENLEGAYWLSHFRVLSLNGNKLTQLPTYALDNALEQNPNMPDALRLHLGGNPWRCDCVFTPGFQEMLMKYENQIRDIKDVKCSYVEGDENSMLPILSLTRSSVCRLPSEYSIRALDLLNIVLASLIVLVLSKLAYDYYYFKRTGRLPWIVTKMP